MLTKIIAKYYDLCREETQICSRKDYWIFIFITFIFNTSIFFMVAILSEFGLSNTILLLLTVPVFILEIYLIVILSIKRFHDVNLSGYWILLLGFNIFILLESSNTFNNKYLKKENTMTEEDKKENENLEKFIEILEKSKENT